MVCLNEHVPTYTRHTESNTMLAKAAVRVIQLMQMVRNAIETCPAAWKRAGKLELSKICGAVSPLSDLALRPINDYGLLQALSFCLDVNVLRRLYALRSNRRLRAIPPYLTRFATGCSSHHDRQ